jgi:hypothetical protein
MRLRQVGFGAEDVEVVGAGSLALVKPSGDARGDGADGELMLAAAEERTLDTTHRQEGFAFTRVEVPAGARLRAAGPHPLLLRCAGTVSIAGVLDLAGGAGAPGGGGGGGGGAVRARVGPGAQRRRRRQQRDRMF